MPFKSRYKIVSQWAIFNLWLLKIICHIHYEVKGLDNISENPCIILCKHQSAWETLALQAIFPPQVWVIKRELLWIPFFGWGLASLNPIAINRRTKRKALNQIIKQGKSIKNYLMMLIKYICCVPVCVDVGRVYHDICRVCDGVCRAGYHD